MGKKRVVKKEGEESVGAAAASSGRTGKGRKVAAGTLHVESSYNNTIVLLSDKEGRALSWSSSGATGAWLSDGIGQVAVNGSLAVRPNGCMRAESPWQRAHVVVTLRGATGERGSLTRLTPCAP